MDTEQAGFSKTILSWIASLCISVVCCAVLFVIFAQYVVDMKHSLTQANDKLETMSLRDEQLLAEIKTLHLLMTAKDKGASPDAVVPPQQLSTTPQPAPEGIAMPAPAPAPVVPPAMSAPGHQATDLAVPPSPPAPLAPLSAAPVPPTPPAPSGVTAPVLPPVSVPSIPAKP